jgi:hypothetical protein
MSDNSIPLSVISGLGTQYHWTQIGIGKTVLTQQPQQGSYWILVFDRRNLQVVYNQLQTSGSVAPDIGAYNTSDYVLVVATTGVGLNNQPQGPFFNFLDLNGAGRELRRINQIAQQFNCGSLGTFGYALVSVLGNTNQPGFEASVITTPSLGPILTVQLMPFTINGQTYYTPVELSNA